MKLQTIIGIFNVIVQCAAIQFVYSKKHFRTGSFYILLLVLSISIVFRTIWFLLTTVLMCTNTALLSSETTTLPRNIIDEYVRLSSLYVDFISNYFSMFLIFLMSLNRCLHFVGENAAELIFTGKHIIVPIGTGILLAVLSSFISITTTKIERKYYEKFFFFLDVGTPEGFHATINQIYFIFPVGSLVFYIILFFHIRKQKRKIFVGTVSNIQKRASQQVFIQIFITVLFYGAMSVFEEVIPLFDFFRNPAYETTLYPMLNVTNYLPELFLPLILLLRNINFQRIGVRVTTFIVTKKVEESRNVVKTVKPKSATI
ncbi:hypothetical protein CRE_09160 [Caenorhabditis remanei]|uniref:Uncharacterized protein n=1 Tax=Caenorhabditis remanei TaxID=31234 RepID=E3LH85_CAERE|nr:hypothetical protein CRE_09160 [Caenorhabditis remanei]